MPMLRKDIFNSSTVESMLHAPGLKWHTNPPDVIPLWIAAPDFPIAPEIKQALRDAVEAEDVFYNTDTAAKAAMAEKITRFNKIKVTPDDVTVIQGVDPSLWLAAKYACKPGDEVILTDPMYTPFKNGLDAAGAKAVYWELNEGDGYRFDAEQLKKLVTKKTRLIGVCNPHNPTGRAMTKQELKAIADIAVDKKINVVSDELWEDIVFDDRKHISIASLSPEVSDLTLTSWGFSKTFGVAGLQLGYMATTNKAMMAEMRKQSTGIQRGSNTLAKAIAPVMLGSVTDYWRRDMMKHLTKIRDLCAKRMNKMNGVTFPDLEGTYVPFPRFDLGIPSKELADRLIKEYKVGLSAGIGFGAKGENHLRICIATSEAIMKDALDRIEAATEKLG
ncbi:MAG: pyridoxal phosphate-dependent aminotransferase [Candidatus Bathyarchaeota archaeon]|nr:pyridoxal phosphate-dependent aminotransferase [Candidatus Bathyarchaeota archaeon]